VPAEDAMTDANILIRLAEPADVEAVRRLLVETWHDTYDSLIGAEKVTEITNSWHSIENLSRQVKTPNSSFLVAEEDGAIVGHALAGAQESVVVLSRLYVRPDRQRRGIGKRLLEAIVSRHPKNMKVRLEVEAGNSKGLSFYLREGFQAVATKDDDGLKHIMMEKRLSRRKRG
jgi:ribosomal protein S18 acetylase RimI-like enzyme